MPHKPPTYGSAATLTSTNPVLDKDQVGMENDTGRFKVGDGVNHWATLAYTLSSASPAGFVVDGGTP